MQFTYYFIIISLLNIIWGYFFWEKESPISELWCTILLKKINCDFHKIEQLCLGLLPNEIHGLWANGSATFRLLPPLPPHSSKFHNCHWWFRNVLRLWTIDSFFTLSALNVVPISTTLLMLFWPGKLYAVAVCLETLIQHERSSIIYIGWRHFYSKHFCWMNEIKGIR